MYRRPPNIANNNEFSLHTLWLEVDDLQSGMTHKACFDMEDGSAINALHRLRSCDVYFKRNYYQSDIDGLSKDLRNKIFPYGLYFPCRSKYDKGETARQMIFHFSHNFFLEHPLRGLNYISRQSGRALLSRLGLKVGANKHPFARDYEAHYSAYSEPKILFQTRVWDLDQFPNSDPKELEELNDMRANTVRALKKTFGEQFIGGLKPTHFARERYPDCISVEKWDKITFMRLVKRCLITITTAGLHHSIGAKLAEYLAAARCIVTEPLRNKLPVPLEKGKHYLLFRNPDECVKACKKLLDDPPFADRMRYNNYNYYWNEVEPSVHMGKCLKLIVGSTTGESQL